MSFLLKKNILQIVLIIFIKKIVTVMRSDAATGKANRISYTYKQQKSTLKEKS